MGFAQIRMNNELEQITETALTTNPYAADNSESDSDQEGWHEPGNGFALFWFDCTGEGTETPRVSVFQESDPGQWTRHDWELGHDPESYQVDAGRANARPVGRTDLVRLLITSDIQGGSER